MPNRIEVAIEVDPAGQGSAAIKNIVTNIYSVERAADKATPSLKRFAQAYQDSLKRIDNRFTLGKELDPTGSSRQAIQAILKEGGTARAAAQKEIAGLTQQIQTAQQAFSQARGGLGGLASGFTSVGAGTGAAATGIGLVVAALALGTTKAIEFGAASVQAFREAEPAALTLANAARAYNGTLIGALNSAELLREITGATRAGAQEIQAFAQQFAAIAGKTGEVDKFTKSLADLAAARGRPTSEIPQIIQSALAGEDQALNRIGLPNPGQLYESYARSIGKTAESLGQAGQAAAIFNAIVKEGSFNVGASTARLNTASGELELVNNRWVDFKVEVGRAITESDEFNTVLTTTIGLLKQIAPPKVTTGDDPVKIAQERADSTFGRLRAAAGDALTGRPGDAVLDLFGLGRGNADVLLKEFQKAQKLLEDARKQDADAQRITAERAKDQALIDAQAAAKQIAEASRTSLKSQVEELKFADASVAKLRDVQSLKAEIAAQPLDVFKPEEARAVVNQLEQVEKQIKETFKSLRDDARNLIQDVTAKSAGDNPFVRLLGDAERAAESLQKRFAQLGPDVVKLLSQLQGQGFAKDLDNLRLTGQLTAFDLQQEAKQLRQGAASVGAGAPSQQEFAAAQQSFQAKIDALTAKQARGGLFVDAAGLARPTPPAGAAAEADFQRRLDALIAKQAQGGLFVDARGLARPGAASGLASGASREIAERIDEINRISATAKDASVAESFRDRSLIETIKGARPEDLTREIREQGAGAYERQATRALQQESEAIELRKVQLKVLNAVDKLLENKGIPIDGPPVNVQIGVRDGLTVDTGLLGTTPTAEPEAPPIGYAAGFRD